jgi:hypothetical protein
VSALAQMPTASASTWPLVLTVDASGSIDSDEFLLQKDRHRRRWSPS